VCFCVRARACVCVCLCVCVQMAVGFVTSPSEVDAVGALPVVEGDCDGACFEQEVAFIVTAFNEANLQVRCVCTVFYDICAVFYDICAVFYDICVVFIQSL